MSFSEMPIALALLRSMSSCTCGELMRNCVKTFMRRGSLAAAPMIAYAAFMSTGKPKIRAVFQFELESAETTDAVDCRRIEREELRLRNLLEEAVVDSLNDGVDAIVCGPCVAPHGLSRHEHQTAVRRGAGETEPADVEKIEHLRLAANDLLGLFRDRRLSRKATCLQALATSTMK